MFSNSPYKKFLKARFPDLYRSKSNMEYYYFYYQCEDYFATTSAKGQNSISFAITFFLNWALFCWQQYKQKIDGKTASPIT